MYSSKISCLSWRVVNKSFISYNENFTHMIMNTQ